jgi:hypothetical protein
MPEKALNTTPLFQTSLREWQAQWKARRGEANPSTVLVESPPVSSPADGSRNVRLGRLRRPRRSQTQA